LRFTKNIKMVELDIKIEIESLIIENPKHQKTNNKQYPNSKLQ
jgi:hypothetical protein